MEEKSSPPHLFATAPLSVWFRLIRENGGVARPYWGKLAKVLTTSSMLLPLRIVEKVFFRARVSRTAIHQSPVFIQGFARAGTTHLHNLLAQDPNFGFVTTFQAVAAPMFLATRGWLARAVAGKLPRTRPMDNMAVSFELPQEEEVALACISDLSPIHQNTFPDRMQAYVDKFSSMNLTDEEWVRWERAYLSILRAATLASGGRRLVLKTPVNLGRTSHLRRLFPDAKFIHITRDPYDMYMSNLRLYRSVLPAFGMADYRWEEVTAAVRSNFVTMMRRFRRDRESIPRGSLVELRFEDLEGDPLGELERVYSALDLPDWPRARTHMADYLDTLTGYRKNRHRIDPSIIEVVDRDWGEVVGEWGYEAPDLDD